MTVLASRPRMLMSTVAVVTMLSVMLAVPAGAEQRRFGALAAYNCTDKGCVDVDLTQLRGGDHPTFTARIRAYGYRYDQDIWVDGQLYQDGGKLFWDFHEKKCTAAERTQTGDTCEHEQTFECDPGEYTLVGFSWIAGDNDIAEAKESVRFPI